MRQTQQTTDVLTNLERRRRVAELLCKAIFLAEAKRAVEPMPSAEHEHEPPQNSTALDDADAEEVRILDYLEVAGRGSPVSIRDALGLSRSATYRALHKLTVAGHVVSSGQTRMLVYQLNMAEPPPQLIGRN